MPINRSGKMTDHEIGERFEAIDDRFDEQDLKFVGLGQKLDKIIGMIKAMRNGKPRSNGTDQA